MSDAAGHDKPWFDRLAHDLRGPLTSLQTAAYLLRTDPAGPNAKDLADLVVRQSQRMGRMIEELDDWSRAEQRRLVDRREQVDLESALDMGLAAVSFGTRVAMGGAMGLLAWFAANVPYWNWYRFPMDFTVGAWLDSGVGLLIASFPIAWWLGRSR